MKLAKSSVTKRQAIQLTALLCVNALIALIIAQWVVSHHDSQGEKLQARIVDQARVINGEFSGQYWHVNSASCVAELRPVRVPLSAPGSYIRNDLLVGMAPAISTRTGLDLLQQQADKYRRGDNNPACPTTAYPLVLNTQYRYQACKSNQLGKEPLKEDDPAVCHDIKPLSVVSANQPGSDIALAPFADSHSGVEAFPIADEVHRGEAAIIVGYLDSRDIDPGAHPAPLSPSQLDQIVPVHTTVGAARVENHTPVYRTDARFEGNPDGFLVLNDHEEIIGLMVHGQRIGGLNDIKWVNYINLPPSEPSFFDLHGTALKGSIIFELIGIGFLAIALIIAIRRKSSGQKRPKQRPAIEQSAD